MRPTPPPDGQVEDLWGDGAGRFRWGLSRPAMVGLGAVALVAVLLAGWYHGRATPGVERVAPSLGGDPRPARSAGPTRSADPTTWAGQVSPGSASAATPLVTWPGTGAGSGAGLSTPATAASVGTVVVHVVGAVRHPGVVRVVVGARASEAVDRAGGLAGNADPASVNLARPVVDGEQIVVGVVGQAPRAPAPGPGGVRTGPSPGAARTPVDLNTATIEELATLPGIGPVLAGRIVAWRDRHQRFTSIDELAEVSGFGQRRVDQLRELVRL
ncbi:MAG: ComEA family DNA-binding protein [Actinomycetes bacterium]